MQNARAIGATAGLDVTGPSRRPSTAADLDFLRALFAESRPDLALLPESVRPALTRMQFDSQLSQYRASAPGAVDWILEVDHDGGVEPVGRCYAWQGPTEHRLLDLAIRCQWRRRGLGGLVLEWLRADAAAAGVPLRLTVWRANHDALRLYDRYGFVADDAGSERDADASTSAGYLRLCWYAGGRR